MTPHELMTDYLAAAHAGDWDAAFGLLADDLVLRIPGRSPQAGLHHGKAAAIDYIATIRARYGPGQIELEVIDMLVGNERVVLLVEERFRGDGLPVTIRRANVYRIAGGRITEVTIYEADQYVVDELLH